MKACKGFIATLAVCALAGIVAIGCNTFRGAGKDLRKGGQAVERAADSVINGKEQPKTITASAESGGWISPSGGVSIPYGSSRTFTVKANRGFHVADVLIDGKSIGAVKRHTFDHVTDNHSISALFTANPR